MGRLFVEDLEGPVYTCLHCRTGGIAVYDPDNWTLVPDFVYPLSLGKLYLFYKCFNVQIGTHEVTITVSVNNQNVNKQMRELFCIACGSRVGLYEETVVGRMEYREGNFYLNRFKLHGPPGLSDDDN